MSGVVASVGSMHSVLPPIELDPSQQAVAHLAATASGVVIGAPGTGKTETVVARVAHLLSVAGLAPDEVTVLTPTRQTATALRDRLAVLGAGVTEGPMARSLTSFAFQITRAHAVLSGEPHPQLLTAGDQDRVIAELLDGDSADAAAGIQRWPADISADVRASSAFRSELRSLMAECTELGCEPDELERLADVAGRPEWGAVAAFIRDYRYAVQGMRAAHREAAQLLQEAAALLVRAPSGPAGAMMLGRPAHLRVVIVDDAQELTRGGVTLLRALRARGVAVLAFGDPDISSGAFRGASPARFAELCELLADVHVLDSAHRASPALTRLTRAVTQSIGAAGRVEHRRPPGPAVDDESSIRTIVAGSPFEEVDRVARVLREWHLIDGIPWGSLAVIAHDTRQVAALEIELGANEVPTRAAGVTRPLGVERIVRELLEIVVLALSEPDERDPEALAAALVTPFGGLDAVGLRRLRARLRHAELAEGGTRAARELLAEAMKHPASFALIDAHEARVAERLAVTMAEVGRERMRGANIHELLWLVWSRAKDQSGRSLATAWERVCAAGGPLAAEIDQALDALVSVFDAAARFVERNPQEAPEPFLRRILEGAVPEDTLTAPVRTDVVAVLTPAAALGSEFEGVIIAGAQDSVWPNVRLRGGILSGWRLADDLAASRDGTVFDVPSVLDRRRAALSDELRLLVRAVSRARSRLVVTVVDDDDLTPGPFLGFFPEPDDTAASDREHPLTLRGLVAQHRRTLTSESAHPASQAHAAGQLALLADARVPGAPVGEWFGIAAASSSGPLRDPDRAAVPVSPSQLHRFAECSLDWAIRALGGDTRSWSAGAGVILHAAMEEVPSGDLDEIHRLIDDRWGELDFEAPWLSRKEKLWAELLGSRLHEYLRRFHDEGGRTIGAESRFRLAIELDAPNGQLPRVHVIDVEGDGHLEQAGSAQRGGSAQRIAVLSGSIDRVEVYPNGQGEDVPIDPDRPDAQRVLIVDLKTGRSELKVSDSKVRDDPQLAAYQLALLEGLVPGADRRDNAGARLVVLSKTLKKQPHYRLARQGAMGDEERGRFLTRVVETARGMASATFDAPIDAHCATSRFGVCALHTVPAVSAS